MSAQHSFQSPDPQRFGHNTVSEVATERPPNVPNDAPYVNGLLEVQERERLSLPSPAPSPGSLSPSHASEHRGSVSTEPAISTLPDIKEGEEDTPVSATSAMELTPSDDSHNITVEKARKPRRESTGGVLKLSAAEMEELTSAPESLPLASPTRLPTSAQPFLAPSLSLDQRVPTSGADPSGPEELNGQLRKTSAPEPPKKPESAREQHPTSEAASTNSVHRRPAFSSRAISTPPTPINRMSSYTKGNLDQFSPKRKIPTIGSRPEPLDLGQGAVRKPNGASKSSALDPPSPLLQAIPIPPMSIPTYLQLELSSKRPSPLYIYRSAASEYPYESSKVKFERLYNFLILPPQLEQVLLFGSLACLDAWLHTFTILPLRFFKAVVILVQWWGQVLAREARFILGFIYHGSGRMLHRRREQQDLNSRSRAASRSGRPPISTASSYMSQHGRTTENTGQHHENLKVELERKSRQGWGRKHRRTKSQPSLLSSSHKGDLLQGAVVICSCIVLMKLDASRMYHSIRGQSSLKLYVIFNALEVCDKLLGALGQDIFECLFSNETLDRDLEGRSKILRPLGMFILALIYNVIHATSLFYQVVALNVAINSYSNALMTLLISNQFVEIKSSVFKKIEKDNLFQLTCADIVERFQLWLILMIIALRNIVEVGGFHVLAGGEGDMLGDAAVPLRSNSILPDSFTILQNWSGEVLSPFILVLGSELLVDWMKHSFISKFNNVKPAVYGRYLDVLTKDYYTNAFVNQNLIKRLGLPVIPLACLFIRSSVQTYHMFLATHLPPPIPSSVSAISESSSPATTAALDHFDNLIRRALGRSTFGVPDSTTMNPWYLPSTDDAIATLTMLVFFLGAFLVLLAIKLVLGMLLLKFSRNRYRQMKKQEHQRLDTEGKRLGTWGMTEVDDDKRRWIYDDDQETLQKLKEKEKAWKEKAAAPQDFGKISRYEMVKRIW